MPFTSVHFPEKKPPAKGYVFSSDTAPIDQAYGSLKEAIRYLDSELDHQVHVIGKADYLIPFAWGDENKKIVEVFGFFEPLAPWPGPGPEVHSWVFLDGKHMPERRNICCGETLQILGKEMECRHCSHSLSEYILTSIPNMQITHVQNSD